MMETDELEPRPTLHSYINELLSLSGDLLANMRGSADYQIVDDATKKMDEVLIEMRHANWSEEIG